MIRVLQNDERIANLPSLGRADPRLSVRERNARAEVTVDLGDGVLLVVTEGDLLRLLAAVRPDGGRS